MSYTKIIIPFGDNTQKQVDDTPLTTFINWDRINKILKVTSLDLNSNESVAGLVIDEAGITVKLKTNLTL